MEKEIQLLAQMERARSNVDNTLQLIYDLCLPDDESIIATRTPGGRRKYPLYANTAPKAAKKFANFLHAIMLPESSVWGQQRPVSDDLFQDRTVREWFWEANRAMSRALSVSNFYPKALETIIDLAVGGIGALYGQANTQLADENGSRFKGVMFHAVPIANFFFLEATADDPERGIVMGDPNRIARVLDMERFEIEDKFGDAKILKDAKPTDKFRIVHLVTPNAGSTSESNLWRSQYIILGKAQSVTRLSASNDPEQVSDGVLPRMPYFVPRMAQKSGEIWPRGFGMDALQDVLEQNVLRKHLLNSVGKDADPPTIVGHEAAMHLELIAGGVSYMDPDRFDQIKQLTSSANYGAVYEHLSELKQEIKEAFLVDQLQLPPSLDRATAEEIVTRRENATNSLSATFAKVEREFPAKVIDWLFAEMLELGALKEPPDAMAAGADTTVFFDSPMANARRQRQIEPINRYVEKKIILAERAQDPSILDPIDFDAIDAVEQELGGINPRIFRDPKDVEQRRQARQEAAARQESREGAKALKPAAEAAAIAQEHNLQ